MTSHTENMKVGLIGYPVEHSLSPAMHNAAFAALGLDGFYKLLPTHPDEVVARIEWCMQEGYAGWNITIPHKERMLPFLHKMGPEVEATGACNTVRVEDGWLFGYNTDIAGFLSGLDEAGGISPNSNVVVLGAGGSARAVVYALATAGHNVLILARNGEQSSSLAASLSNATGNGIRHNQLAADKLNNSLQNAALLVNCTPAGMWPHTDTTPLPEHTHIPPHLLVYDLVYRPRPTRLLTTAENAGCRTQDGLSMLIGQGAAAFHLWTGQAPPLPVMREACFSAAGK